MKFKGDKKNDVNVLLVGKMERNVVVKFKYVFMSENILDLKVVDLFIVNKQESLNVCVVYWDLFVEYVFIMFVMKVDYFVLYQRG